MKQSFGLPALLAVSLACAGCFGTETGNPPSVALGLTARSSDPSVASLDPAAASTRVESAWIAIADVRLIEGTACDHVAPSPAAELAVADAVDGVALGLLPDGASCGVRVSIVPVLEPPSGAPPALAGRSLLVRGTLSDGRPFEIGSDLELPILVQGAPFAANEGDSLLLAVDVAGWLGGVDLSAAPADPDGVVRVAPSGPPALRDAFEGNAAGGLDLFDDADGDGALDASEEAAGPLATGHGAP